MTGQSIYEHSFDTPTVLLIGNEGRGLSKSLLNSRTKLFRFLALEVQKV
ncbi:MAG: hypothetical protein CM15mP59_2740 [Flavobacteriaceae bacterium]|nr:MAG: hypothetical protein CM15mP59_2740 [Flavobacteriaceae bacterium]